MVALQIISKVLESKNISIIEDNLLTEDYFVGFEGEYEFIMDHYEKYGIVPDKATFLGVFDDMELVEVTESDEYLVNTIREENLYYRSIPVVKKIAELLKTDSNAAVEYMHHALEDLKPNYDIGGLDIIKNHHKLEEAVEARKDNADNYFITTGFPELDDITGGLQRGEEFAVIVARINQGKSWILEKIATHIWEIGYNVGYLSPEMGVTSIGLRFDTLHGHFSNSGLFRGTDIDTDEYSNYSQQFKERTNKFIVSTPQDFNKRITVSKLKNWIRQHKLDAVAIDGVSYLTDERAQRGDTRAIMLTNISEDLMELSCELSIPIIVVVQANRGGAVLMDNDDTPNLEHIKDSDGLAANASQVWALRQQKESNKLIIEPKKGRNCRLGTKLIYDWNIDTGEFGISSIENGGSNISIRQNNKEEEYKPKKRKKDMNFSDTF